MIHDLFLDLSGRAAALLDTAMSGAAHTVITGSAGYTTVELSIRYVRPVPLDGGDMRCRGRVLHAGRRLVFTDGEVRDQSGKMVAHGTATLMVVDSRAR